MTFRRLLRLGGLIIILASILLSVTNIAICAGYHNTAIQGLYEIGFMGLVLACSSIHLAQARKAGTFGLICFLATLLSLIYAHIDTFLIFAGLAGFPEAHEALVASWKVIPGARSGVSGVYIGFVLLGFSVATAGVFPRWAGVLVALGAALQVPAQYTMKPAGSLFFTFTIAGSILFGVGLAWIGWTFWSGQRGKSDEAGFTNLDRFWGAPTLLLTGLVMAVDAMLNMFGDLSFASGLTHLISYTFLAFTAFLLFAAHGERASWWGGFGFVFAQIGAVLYVITAFLIVAQLAGVIDNNRMLMVSWENIPVGRVGQYLSILGIFLLGVEAIRSGVFPPISGWLVVIGIALALPFVFTIQAYYLGIFWVTGAVIEGTGVGWMGWNLLTGKSS